jgi:ABC-type amino acid transport substrate-binding protein
MMRSHHLGLGRVLLAVCLVGMIEIAQGQFAPTLALLRSGVRPLVVGGVSEYTPFNIVGPDGQFTGMDREIIPAAAKRPGGGYKNALLQPIRATFAVRKDSKELREALDGVLKEMWVDGSLNKIKRVYLDPLEIEPAASP